MAISIVVKINDRRIKIFNLDTEVGFQYTYTRKVNVDSSTSNWIGSSRPILVFRCFAGLNISPVSSKLSINNINQKYVTYIIILRGFYFLIKHTGRCEFA